MIDGILDTCSLKKKCYLGDTVLDTLMKKARLVTTLYAIQHGAEYQPLSNCQYKPFYEW